MTTLTVRLSNFEDAEARLLEAAERAESGRASEATPTLGFSSYEVMHRILAPSRLEIVKTLVGTGPLSIREVARRLDRDVQAVHRDVMTLINSGVIDRGEKGIEFPYDGIRFEFDIKAGKAA
ncbi:HVO_A0114 family putative DNA-binding protein [Rhizobium sp. C4]|uniref:HVO_A0114 family putative DNA-binding protein n=1 Tax=Rhizobium sp. C4 TaxID=1349800 RepID=UPI001E3BD169|nr:transcriptional regulator [Rhizobium sp. C4]MCD2173098.1 transcriptional regulator [Rhizobium sp. C4]